MPTNVGPTSMLSVAALRLSHREHTPCNRWMRVAEAEGQFGRNANRRLRGFSPESAHRADSEPAMLCAARKPISACADGKRESHGSRRRRLLGHPVVENRILEREGGCDMYVKRVRVRSFEAGLYFLNGEFKGVLDTGRHWIVDLPGRSARVDVVSKRDTWLVHEQLDLIVKSGLLGERAIVLDLQDHERALVWVEGRFSALLRPGLYAYWTGLKRVRIELVDVRKARFEHSDFAMVVRSPLAKAALDICEVQRDRAGVLFLDGRYAANLEPGLYAFWQGAANARLVEVDLRETALDISGQDIMTADKVTLRVNATIVYRVNDARRAVCASDDCRQALYREAQLALRALVGVKELDAFLADKDSVAVETAALLRKRVEQLGLELISIGIRDVILPGEMKDLMNKVTEAKKAAEANLIARREETAAMRSQANTAKVLAENPTLMRLRELEVLEKVASAAQLKIVLGEKGLAERVVNLL